MLGSSRNFFSGFYTYKSQVSRAVITFLRTFKKNINIWHTLLHMHRCRRGPPLAFSKMSNELFDIIKVIILNYWQSFIGCHILETISNKTTYQSKKVYDFHSECNLHICETRLTGNIPRRLFWSFHNVFFCNQLLISFFSVFAP